MRSLFARVPLFPATVRLGKRVLSETMGGESRIARFGGAVHRFGHGSCELQSRKALNALLAKVLSMRISLVTPRTLMIADANAEKS